MPFEPVQFGKYTLYEKLAVGGMALLYRARVQGVKGFQKDLVIKQILPQYSGMNDFIDMFIDEAKISVNLNHANIVPVYELGEIDGQLYIAMEYVAGKDLQAILEACEDKKTSVPPRVAAYILMGACRGLDYAHNKKDEATRQPLNIIHRDISPNNVIVSNEGEVKIIDFGIAKASIKVSVTQFGTLKGKMVYMSPEQAAEMKLDPRSDVFSAGILLYELVTGKKPYGGDNFAITQDNVKKAAFPTPDKVKADLPPPMTQIILKAMAKDPAERYQSAFEFERALTDFLFSTGQNVYARDVAAFLQDLFAETTDEKLIEAKGGIKNLTDGGPNAPGVTTDTQPRGPSPGSLTPTRDIDNDEVSRPPAETYDDFAARLDQSRLPSDVLAADEPAPDASSVAILGALPEEGVAIDDGTESGGDMHPKEPESAPTPSTAKNAPGLSLLGDEPFDFEIPPPPVTAQEPASQRETVVTRRLPTRQPVPVQPLEKATPAPAAGREGVVPSAGRVDATRTNPSAAREMDRTSGEGATETTSSPGILVADLAGVVPDRNGDEETAPGGSARGGSTSPVPPLLSPRSSPTSPAGASRPAPAAAAPRPAPTRDVTPPRGTRSSSPGAMIPPRPAFAETPVSPSAGSRPNPVGSVPSQPSNQATPASVPQPAPKAQPSNSPAARPPTPNPPWQTAPDAPASKRGLLDRIVGRGKTSPTAPSPPVTPTTTAQEVSLEGLYESPADFLTNHYATYGSNNNRGLFLSTAHLDAKLGVNIPLQLVFANPQSSFVVHGRVIWRRAKEGTSKGRRLPAGLAIEFAEDLSDDLEALYAYLGLP